MQKMKARKSAYDTTVGPDRLQRRDGFLNRGHDSGSAGNGRWLCLQPRRFFWRTLENNKYFLSYFETRILKKHLYLIGGRCAWVIS